MKKIYIFIYIIEQLNTKKRNVAINCKQKYFIVKKDCLKDKYIFI